MDWYSDWRPVYYLFAYTRQEVFPDEGDAASTPSGGLSLVQSERAGTPTSREVSVTGESRTVRAGPEYKRMNACTDTKGLVRPPAAQTVWDSSQRHTDSALKRVRPDRPPARVYFPA